MCDITVEGKEHCYYANNMLTHNCGEEVCIAANLSSEPVWCNAINNGSDVHMESSKKIFGVADKEKRGIVKTCTFLVIYGGGAYTLAKRLKVAVKEAEEMFSHFYKGMASVARWIKFNTETARRKGIIFTYYGRPRLLYKYYSSSDKKDWAFADRSATNTICQGNCIETSRILTNKGIYQINDFKHLVKWDSTEAVPNVKVWNGEKFCRFGLFDQGIEHCKKVVLSDGSVFQSGSKHLFKCLTDSGVVDIHIKDLKVGDRILKSLPQKVEFEAQPFTDFQFYTAGYYLGDGYLGDGALRICCSLAEVLSLRKKFLEHFRLGALKFNILDDGRTIEEIRSILPCDGTIVLCKNRRGDSSEFRVLKEDSEFLFDMGFEHRVAKTKRIPKSIFNSSLRQRANFIKGLYDSDGGKTESQFRWHMCQREILEDLQYLLRTCGLRSRIYDLSDGTFTLVVQDSKSFAEFVGVEDKSRTSKKYGRIQDNCIIPNFKVKEFLEHYNKVVSNGYWKEIGLTCEQWKRDNSLVCKLRDGKNVGIDCYNSLCKSLKFDSLTFPYYYSEVASISEGEYGQTFCLSLWDESHQYEAEGMIHHNCIPVSLHIECKNKAIRLSKFFLTKQTFQDGREGILSARRSGMCYFITTKSGDFSYAEENHGFIHGSSKHPKYRRVNQGLDVKLLTSKLQSKLLPFSKSFFRLFTKSGRLQAKNTVYNLYVKDEVLKTRHLATNFFSCWLTGSKFLIKDIRYACSLRSIASVFGYNLVLCKNQDLSEVGTTVEDFSIESESDDVKVQIVSKDDLGEYSVPEYEVDEKGIHKLEPRKGLKYKLKWGRKKKVIVSAVRKVRMEPVGSVTMTKGYQMYDAVGFKNKNTGADLMRMLLCKYYQRCEDDSEFKENTRLYFHVHDECNLAVRKQYLFKFFYIWRDLMWVRNKNWLTPLKSDTGIGTTWGNGVNVVGITPENKLIVKGVNDTPELMERTKQAVKATGLKWDDDLGLDRYKIMK